MIRRIAYLALLAVPAVAEAACRQALSLGLDVSSSVDDAEYRLQLDGVISALNAPSVQDILFQTPDAPVSIHVFEWSGPINQTVIVPWTELTDPLALATVTGQLSAHQRGVAAPTTSIGDAILAGVAFLEQRPDCWKRTLDLSGDGETNVGTLPEDIPPDALPVGMTVNGLVVGAGNLRGDDDRFADIKRLSSYYRTRVIRGPGAFVETALGYSDYANAMERKLLRELASIAVGQLDLTLRDQ